VRGEGTHSSMMLVPRHDTMRLLAGGTRTSTERAGAGAGAGGGCPGRGGARWVFGKDKDSEVIPIRQQRVDGKSTVQHHETRHEQARNESWKLLHIRKHWMEFMRIL
jgi:hypothetical protein